jgi:sugar/nucleoside kinase (ribokinase family)
LSQPLADVRGPSPALDAVARLTAAEVDALNGSSRSADLHPPAVQVFGTVFFDLVFSDLPSPPRPGTEIRTGRLGLSPGGSANIAVALARLGLRARLSAPFADDAFGHFLWAALEHEAVDLCGSPRMVGWTTPLTVSLAYKKERSLVTYEELPPDWASLAGGATDDVGGGTRANREAEACYLPLSGKEAPWLEEAKSRYGLLFADVGWDPSERWDGRLLDELALVDVFMPNAAEAMAYTRTSAPTEAAAALADHVALAVVKCGEQGAVAAGQGLARPIRTAALRAEAVDTTGAGDVFDAAFIYASLAGWPIERRLLFANLCAGESVRYLGGSLSAPCWRDLAAWWHLQDDPELQLTFAWLPHLLETCHPGQMCQRPCASLPWHTADQPAGTSPAEQAPA